MQTKTLGLVLIVVIIVTLLGTVCIIKSAKYRNHHKDRMISNQETVQGNISNANTYPASVSTFVPQVNLTLIYPGQFTLKESKMLYSQAASVSFDFVQQFIKGKNEYFPANISFLTSESVQKYQDGCSTETGLVEKPCLPEGYSGDSYKSLQKSLANKTGYKDYKYMNLGGTGYLVENTKCSGDTCYNRQYSTIKGDIRIDTVVTIFDEAFQDEADQLITEIVVK